MLYFSFFITLVIQIWFWKKISTSNHKLHLSDNFADTAVSAQ